MHPDGCCCRSRRSAARRQFEFALACIQRRTTMRRLRPDLMCATCQPHIARLRHSLGGPSFKGVATRMCGIVGIVGKSDVAQRLFDGLKRLEYRGYDSAGICTIEGGQLERRRAEGKLDNLAR